MGGTVTYWDAPTGGTNLGAPPIPQLPALAGPLTYYAEYTALGSGVLISKDVVSLAVEFIYLQWVQVHHLPLYMNHHLLH
ncbi:MAG: hypothetical protein IPO02_10240 [Bacteroidetes bacterium]|nr:hypothetical protein [Bacteroidota bacterium]